MRNNQESQMNSFIRDKSGHIVLWQSPNVPLCGWFVFKVLSMFEVAEQLKMGAEQLSTAFLFTWAFLEITKGVNYFRRLLGIIVMIAITLSFFKQ